MNGCFLDVIAAEQQKTHWRAVDQDTGEVIIASDEELKAKLKEDHVYRMTRVKA